MTPTELTQYLDALRGAGVMQAVLKLPAGEIQVVFSPEGPPGSPITDDISPGAWKRWAGADDGETK